MVIAVAMVAAALSATAATLPSVLGRARGGDTLTLAPGQYATIVIKDRAFVPPLTIEAGTADVAGVFLEGATGLVWRGGAVSAPESRGRGPKGYAFTVFRSSDIVIADAKIGDANRGIVMGAAHHVLISKNILEGFHIDGINVGSGSHDITIDGNFCESFATGEAHPDCIQGWSRAGRPVSDIVVTGNTTRGRVQGIYFGNIPHRKGGGDPGFDRIRIENNIVEVSLPNGIMVVDCRDCIVRYNKVSSLPGARFRAKVFAQRGDTLACGNDVANLERMMAAMPCD